MATVSRNERQPLPPSLWLRQFLKAELAPYSGRTTSACYIIYNAIDWPGISTVTTCMLTALSTIGSSHQKQILRIGGCLIGGLVIGMGSQIFVLPHVDSITGFAILVMSVTALSSWVTTSSPRLSYLGFQMAVAFYLIHLQEFSFQTSLSVARDRFVGILLGCS
jgi:multidrug resistance protein MdtO